MTETTNGNTFSEQLCKNCGEYVSYGPTTDELVLCETCHLKFYRYPIPKWLLAIGFLILCLIIYQFYHAFPSGLDYRRTIYQAEQAFNDHRYMTAMNKYEVLQEINDLSTDDHARLFISYVKNYEYDKAATHFNDTLDGKNIDNDALYLKIDESIKQLDDLYDISEMFNDMYPRLSELSHRERIIELEDFLLTHPNEYYAYDMLSNAYFELEDYARSLDILNKQKEIKPGLLSNINIRMAGTYRQLGKFSEAYASLDEALQENKEDLIALCSVARTKLKEKKYEEALNLLVTVDPTMTNHTYYDESLALAYHFNNRIQERDQLMQKYQDNTSFDYEFLTQVFNNESNLYN